MYDIITFGSATQDIYFISKKFLPASCKNCVNNKGVCFALGSKVEIEGVFVSTGGGGTNTAATFANQGFKTAYCGQTGDDLAGEFIIKDLKKIGIDTNLVLKTKKLPSNMGMILTYPGRDRTILAYRGASDILEKKDIPWKKIKNTEWFYLAPFSGKLANLTEDLVKFAKRNKIRVAFNPGYSQLTLPKAILKRILNNIDILILNREEASLLTGIPYKKEEEIFKKIDDLTKGIAIMTKGGEGAVVSDGRYLYRAPSLHLKFVDATGAGDAFGSGFVSGIIQKNDIVFSIQLAMANSGFNTTELGAKDGLLKKKQKWGKVKVEKISCCPTCLCQVKKL